MLHTAGEDNLWRFLVLVNMNQFTLTMSSGPFLVGQLTSENVAIVSIANTEQGKEVISEHF